MQMTLSFAGDINVPLTRSTRSERPRGVRPIPRTGREHAVLLVDRPAPSHAWTPTPTPRVQTSIRVVPPPQPMEPGAMEQEPERWDGLY